MTEDSSQRNQSQEKKAFVIHASPAWLDQHQDWITAGARQLYKALRSLMDQKTGRLFIPGKGWIRLRTVELKAGMSEDTRLKYTRELVALGCYHVHRDRVTRVINGRERKVLGQAQITISQLKPPKTHKHSRSSTPGNSDDAQNQHKHGSSSTPESEKANTGNDSSTPGNAPSSEPEPQASVSSTPGNKNILLHPESSSLEETRRQVLSEGTTSGPPSVLPFVMSGNISKGGGVDFQGSPARTAPLTGISSKPQYNYPPQAAAAVDTLRSWLRSFTKRFGVLPSWKLNECKEYFLKDINSLGIPFKEQCELFESTVREFYNPPSPAPTPEPIPPDFSKLNPKQRARALNLSKSHPYWRTYGRFEAYILKSFGQVASKLSLAECVRAWYAAVNGPQN